MAIDVLLFLVGALLGWIDDVKHPFNFVGKEKYTTYPGVGNNIKVPYSIYKHVLSL